jgi:hypothetical protein
VVIAAPEPSSIVALATGLLLLASARWRTKARYAQRSAVRGAGQEPAASPSSLPSL